MFRVSTWPLSVNSTLHKHMSCEYCNLEFKKLLKSYHINDLNSGSNSVEEGLSRGVFNLRKFKSNLALYRIHTYMSISS